MDKFVTGVVVGNPPDAEYEGIVYTRWLKMQLSNSQVIQIFDADLLSESLEIEAVYSVVVKAFVLSGIRAFTSRPNQVEQSKWEGTIIDGNWQVPQMQYRADVLNLYEGGGLALVATPIGKLLIDYDELPATSDNTFLQWDLCRLDLLAVL